MSDYFYLSEAQLNRIKPYFPKSHGVPRVDDRRVLSSNYSCPKAWSAMARCSCGIWTS